MKAFFGPNPCSSEPVVVAELKFGARTQAEILAARARLTTAYPGWLSECPDLQAMESPLALAWLLAHWCRALLNSVRGMVEAAGARSVGGGQVEVWVGFHEPRITAKALELAVQAVNAACQSGQPFPPAALTSAVSGLQATCRKDHPDYVARILMLAARAQGIPYLSSPMGRRCWQYGWGAKGRVFLEASPVAESWGGKWLAEEKSRTTFFLRALGYPTTQHLLASTVNEARAAANSLGWPVVVKPGDRGRGTGVTVNISSEDALDKAFLLARAASSAPILIERFVEGFDHRLLVVRGKLVAVTRREAATVVGDGVSSVAELVGHLNAARSADPLMARYLKVVKAEAAVLEHLASQGLTMSSVVERDRRVTLRGNANVSTGGTPTDVTKDVHPEVRAMAEAIAGNLGLTCVGVDYITTDIRQSWRQACGAVVEVNATPGVDLHVTTALPEVEMGRIVLGNGIGRIPIVVVVANEADQKALLTGLTVLGMLARPGTAWMDSAATRIDGIELERARRTQPERVRQLLTNRQVQRAVMCLTAEQAIQVGLPVDRFSAAIFRGPVAGDRSVAELLRGCAQSTVDASAYSHWPSAEIIESIGCALSDDLGTTEPESFEPASDPLDQRIVPAPDGTDATDGWPSVKAASRFRLGPVDFEWIKAGRRNSGPAAFSLMRNERYLLPWFLDHHRKLGVENFVIYDDHSTDGTREYLEEQADCSILTSSCGFNELLGNGLSFHHFARNVVPESVFPGRWVLTLDADEFLFIPTRFSNLPDMVGWLDRKAFTCVFGAMLDFYPASLGERNHAPDMSPFAVSRFFDRSKGFVRDPRTGGTKKMPGGVRARLQRMLYEADPAAYETIYKGKGYAMAALVKVPMLKTGHSVVRLNAHQVNARPPVGLELCLAHFKFTPDIDEKISQSLQRRQHYLNSIEYRFLDAAFSCLGDAKLVYEDSVEFDGPASLEAAGHLRCEIN